MSSRQPENISHWQSYNMADPGKNESRINPSPDSRNNEDPIRNEDETDIPKMQKTDKGRQGDDTPPKLENSPRNIDEPGTSRTLRNSLDTSYSSELGIYTFYKTHGRNISGPNIAKTEAFIYMVIPPDGGYAWIILAMAFCCQVIVDGIVFSIGVLLPYIAEELSLSHRQTGLMASTQIGIYFFSSPISSAFINKFGFRAVALVGVIIAVVGIILASFSQGTLSLVCSFGLISGPAMGMIGVTSTIIVNYYFERYRAVVGGIASSATGFGVILISLLNVHLVKHINWRNTMRVHALLMLLVGAMVLSYKEVRPTKVGHYVEYLSDEEDDTDDVEIASLLYSVQVPELAKSVTSISSTARNINLRMTPIINQESEQGQASFIQRICPYCFIQKRPTATLDGKRFVIAHDPLDRDDIFYDGYPNYATTMRKESSEIIDIEILPGKEDKAQTISYSLSMIRPLQTDLLEQKRYQLLVHPKIWAAFKGLFDLQLLQLAEFRVLMLETFLFPMGFNIPYVYSSSRARINQVYANLLPVFIGITNIVFRLSMGFIAHRTNFHPAYLSGGGMVLGSLVTFISAFVGESQLEFQFFYVLCFGIAAASFASLRSIIYVKVLGLERLTNAYGLTSMVMGIGVFIGTNLAGFFNNYFHSYTVSFAFSGIVMTIAGCLKLCIPEYATYRKAVDMKKSQKRVRFAKARRIEKCCWCFKD